MINLRGNDRNNNSGNIPHHHHQKIMASSPRNPEEELKVSLMPQNDSTSGLSPTSLPLLNNMAGQFNLNGVNFIQQLEQVRLQNRQIEGIAALHNLAQSVNEANRNLLLNIYSFYYLLNTIQSSNNE